jgi:hypothetical protein
MIAWLHDGPTKFALAGLDLNVPVDLVPAGKYSKATNAVSKIEGRIETRDGITKIASIGAGVPIHTIFKLTQFNPAVLSERLVAVGQQLYTSPLSPAAFTALTGGPLFDNSPLSIIQFRFEADPSAWAIIANANGMMKRRSGYYQVLGVAPPTSTATATTAAGTGLLDSTLGTGYDWRYTYLNPVTLSESNGSPPMLQPGGTFVRQPTAFDNPAVTGQSPFVNPASAFDGIATTFADGVAAADSGSSQTTSCRWRALTSVAGTASSVVLSVDSLVLISKGGIGTNNVKLQYSTDSGITWTNIYSTSMTRARTTDAINLPVGADLTALMVRSTATATSGASNITGNTAESQVFEISVTVTLQAGAPLLLILTNQSANVCVTPPTDQQETAIRLYRRGGTLPNNWFQVGQYTVASLSQGACGAGTLLINDNIPDSQVQLGAILPQNNFQPVQSMQAVNFPLPVIFGPSDGRVLACGDPARPDAVYFSNKGNADIWGAEAWVVVANPGEQMMNGLVYNLRTFAFSRERLYIMLPNIVPGITFLPAETPCRHGLKGRWAFAAGEQGIYFVSKDGVYRTSGGPEQSIIDDSIRPLFPTREASVGTATNGYDAVNMDDEDGLRMVCHNSEIWFYYTGATTGKRQLMIYDERRSRWRPGTYTPAMQMAYSEPSGDSSLLYGGVDGSLYAAGGNDDAGAPISVSLTTGSFDQQRPLNLKEYLNVVFDLDPGGATRSSPVRVIPRLNGGILTASIMYSFTQANVDPVPAPWVSIGLPGFVAGQIINNRYSGRDGLAADMIYDGGIIWAPDQSSKATLRALKQGSGVAVLSVRQHVGNGVTIGDGYALVLAPIIANGGAGLPTEAHISRFLNGVETLTNSVIITPQLGDVFEIRITGNTIICYQNGAAIPGMTRLDAVAVVEGRPGIGADAFLGTATDIQWSDWVGTGAQVSLDIAGIGRQRVPLSLADIYGYNIEYDITWDATTAIKPVLYQYETLYRHEPAEVTHWELPKTDMGMQGWFHIRDIYIVLRSVASVTLQVIPDTGPAQSFVLPSTGGLKDTLYVKLAANKSNSYAFAMDSSAPFRLYASEVEVRAKPWLTNLGYKGIPLIGREQLGSMNVE